MTGSLLSAFARINPDLTIDAHQADSSALLSCPPDIQDISGQLACNGFLQSGPIFCSNIIDQLRNGVYNLKNHGLPPIYIYIYDQAWQLFSALSPLTSHFLGDDFRLLPNFWAWHIPCEAGVSGWPPHRDCQATTRFTDGLGGDVLMSMSLWIPLTDATEENGCMHVLPRPVQEK